MNEIIVILTAAAKTIGISPSLLIAVCMTETNLKHVDTPNDGKSTSYGVCQIKLETAQFMGRVHKDSKMLSFTEEDIRSINGNALAAAYYLKYQIKRYDGSFCKAVAAYNAGRFKESKRNIGKPFNMAYVEKVQNNLSDPDLSLSCEDDLVAVND